MLYGNRFSMCGLRRVELHRRRRIRRRPAKLRRRLPDLLPAQRAARGIRCVVPGILHHGCAGMTGSRCLRVLRGSSSRSPRLRFSCVANQKLATRRPRRKPGGERGAKIHSCQDSRYSYLLRRSGSKRTRKGMRRWQPATQVAVEWWRTTWLRHSSNWMVSG